MQNMVDKVRSDQVLKFNYNSLGDEQEVAELKKICERMSWLPFELNKYCPDLSLQVNENMDVHYFSENGSYYKKHKNSDKKYDNGIKITAFVVIREFNKLDTEDQHRVKVSQDEKNEWAQELNKGDLVIVKSRELFMEFLEHFEKTFYILTHISGPLKPHEK
jgi:hypothetical protein